MITFICFIFVFVSFHSFVYSVNPGFKTFLTQSGINYAKTIGVEYLKKDVSSISIPNQSGKYKAPVIGDIDMTLSKIELKGLSFPTTTVAIKVGTGITLAVKDMSASISLDWEYKEKSWPHVKDHGSADIDVSDTSISVTIKLTDSKEMIHATGESDSVSIGKLDIHLHGGASWLYNLFVDALKDKIKKAAEDAMEKAIISSINTNLNAVLETIPHVQTIGDDVEVDFGLVGNPDFTKDFILAPERGEFYETTSHTEAPYTPPTIPSPTPSEELQVVFSTYVLDTLFYRYYQRGLLKYTITDKNLPPGPVHLNTSTWQVWVPPLAEKYPNMAMEIKLSADAPPTSRISTKGVLLKGNVSIEVLVLDPKEKDPVPAFVLTMQADGLIDISVNDKGKIFGSVSNASDTVSLKRSYIGSFDPTALETLVTFIVKGVVIPMMNEELQKGVLLPVIKHVTLQKPTISYHDKYVEVATDIVYTM